MDNLKQNALPSYIPKAEGGILFSAISVGNVWYIHSWVKYLRDQTQVMPSKVTVSFKTNPTGHLIIWKFSCYVTRKKLNGVKLIVLMI